MSPDEAARYNKYWALKSSTCTTNELIKYLKNYDIINKTNYAEEFIKTGAWSLEIQIPKAGDVLKSTGEIDWNQVTKGGYTLDSIGNAEKDKCNLKVGDILGRYVSSDRRYASPVDGKSYNYNQRSLPYVEEPTQYY